MINKGKKETSKNNFYCSTEEAVKKNWISEKTIGGTKCGTQCFWCK